jgi:hypothetical protein
MPQAAIASSLQTWLIPSMSPSAGKQSGCRKTSGVGFARIVNRILPSFATRRDTNQGLMR